MGSTGTANQTGGDIEAWTQKLGRQMDANYGKNMLFPGKPLQTQSPKAARPLLGASTPGGGFLVLQIHTRIILMAGFILRDEKIKTLNSHD